MNVAPPPPVAAVDAVTAVGPTAPPAGTIDAFHAALHAASAALMADPAAMGQQLLRGVDGFGQMERRMHASLASAVGIDGAPLAPAGIAVPTGAAAPTDVAAAASPLDGAEVVPDPRNPAAAASSYATMVHKLAAVESQSVGMMMKTYDFAMEATMVSNAATTFTSSVNTLIKTQ